jgi:hypothetical protein
MPAPYNLIEPLLTIRFLAWLSLLSLPYSICIYSLFFLDIRILELMIPTHMSPVWLKLNELEYKPQAPIMHAIMLLWYGNAPYPALGASNERS